jgi:hypothetical protein
MEPRYHWNVGEPRLGPDGTEIVPKNEETYWAHRFPDDATLRLPSALEACISRLEPHKDFLREFIMTGGDVEFFIGWFTTERFGGDVKGGTSTASGRPRD